MKVEDYAKTLLCTPHLREKLITPEIDFSPSSFQGLNLEQIPLFPGRPQHFLRAEKALFPSLGHLGEPRVRGEVLHFFANHELLALELMALLLLRFPEAPLEFRKSIVRTIQEEQHHLQLYIRRMNALGVEFGDLPTNDYFWNCMKGMSSPLEFLTQMSLTFEQANLDYSLFFMKEIQKTGDQETTQILEEVYRDEIGHVKNGLVWFNRWRNPNESEWNAYRKILPPPLTPRRAKGFQFSADSRRKAGLSENFIQELEVYSSSKGRPPRIWKYNPHCEQEVARGKPGFSPTGRSLRIAEDLEATPLFLAQETDVVWVKKRPSLAWLSQLQKSGFCLPEWSSPSDEQAPKLGGFYPWGWSPDSFALFQPFGDRLVEVSGGNKKWCDFILNSADFSETPFAQIYSKAWSLQFLKDWVSLHPETEVLWGPLAMSGWVYKDFHSFQESAALLLHQHRELMIKAPYGTSGSGSKKLRSLSELQGPLGGWVKKILKQQNEIVLEPYLERVSDLSLQMEVKEEKTQLLEVRRFLTGNQHEFRGTYLGTSSGLNSEMLRCLHSSLNSWHLLARDLGKKLFSLGYQGPVGIDALIWNDSSGSLRLKPLVEINPRWTHGRVALALESHLAPGVKALWAFLSIRKILNEGYSSVTDFVSEITQRFPLRTSPLNTLEEGVLFTNDPSQAQEVLTLLMILPNPDLERLLTAFSSYEKSAP